MISEEESIPRKSEAYLLGQSVFFEQFNDVDFFVEDEFKESLYFAVLKKLFPDIRLEKIFPLGGKEKIFNHEASNRSSRSYIYLVDKDFDDLLGKKRNARKVIYLKRYSIENYFIEIEALEKFIISEKPTLTTSKLRENFNAKTFTKSVIVQLQEISVYFLIAQKNSLGIPNCSLPIARFCNDKKKGVVCLTKVNEYREQIKKELDNLGVHIDDEFEACKIHFEMDCVEDLIGVNICGKHILDLIQCGLSKLFKFKGINFDSFSYRLAEYCSFESLAAVRKEICDSMN